MFNFLDTYAKPLRNPAKGILKHVKFSFYENYLTIVFPVPDIISRILNIHLIVNFIGNKTGMPRVTIIIKIYLISKQNEML